MLADRIISASAGTEGQMWHLIRGLQASGMNVHLAVLRDSEFVAQGGMGCPVDVLNLRRILEPRAWWRLFRFAWRHRSVGLVHIWMNDSAIIGPPIFKLNGYKVIVSRRDLGFWYTPRILKALRWSNRFVDRVVANAEAIRSVVSRSERVAPERITVINNGLFERPMAPGAGAPAALADIPAGAQKIVLLANVRQVKRIDLAIAALARVADRHPSAVLVCIGDYGSNEEARILQRRLQASAEEQGIGDRVFFTGAVPNAADWLGEFQIGMLTSDSEGLSNTILEYMRAGLPVLATEVGGSVETVEHGLTGYLVPPGSPDALAERLDELLRDEPLRKRMGQEGDRRCATRFSGERMVDAYRRLYRQVANQKPRRGAYKVLER